MKTIRIIAIAAVVMALAACTKEQGYNESSFKKGQEVTLKVTADVSATKVTSELNTTSGEVSFKWETGDSIKVTIGDKSAAFKLKSGAGSASATFTGTMPDDGNEFDVQFTYNDPDLTSQVDTTSEPIPHNMMKLAATGCSVDSPTFTLAPQNAALRLNLYGTSQTVSKIVVTNTTSSETPKPTYTLNISPAVTLPAEKADSMAFFIVVPAGDWNFSAEVFDNAATPASICSFSPSAAQTFAANKILNMPAKEVAVPAPSSVLSGDFTINSSGTTVKFSKGNLYYDGSTSTWGFEANQYDYRTYAGANSCIGGTVSTTGTPTDNWGSFGWVGASSAKLTDNLTKYGMSTSTTISDYGNSTSDALKADWADISTLPQVSGRKWKTMSSSEWTYLLNTRKVTVNSVSKTSYGEGSVNGVNGLIILPDNWNGSVCSGFTYGTSSWSNTFTESTTPKWSDMESAGCVFLPAAGYRGGSSLSGVGSYGYYWSSTPHSSDSDGAYRLYSGSGNVNPESSYYRGYGYSVRLVSVAQ